MVVDAGHEIGMHGYSHENPIAMTPEQEEAVMDRCIELIEQHQRPAADRLRRTVVGIQHGHQRAATRKGIKYDHSLMNDDFHPFYVRVGDSWTPIDYSKHPNEWMRPLVRGEETDLIDIPGELVSRRSAADDVHQERRPTATASSSRATSRSSGATSSTGSIGSTTTRCSP